MNQSNAGRDALIASIFSDETESFRRPAEPEVLDAVSVRLRVMKDAGVRVSLMKGDPALRVGMHRYKTDAAFDWYEAKLYLLDAAPVTYAFLIEWDGGAIRFDRTGAREIDGAYVPDPARAFRVLPGFHVPEWAKGAIQYQIMPDRFRNGCPESDVRDRECWYAGGYLRRASGWDAPPEADGYRCFYGGDLPGVMEKLDYLQSLGVEVVYFNPIFVSPSSHKYDTQDYGHIDPHLAPIPRDGGRVLKPGQRDNAQATRYIRRTTLAENLEAADRCFAELCQEMHRRGMRIILDGVFNHCGSFNPWMDREGLYRQNGAYGDPDSPYRDYFVFTSPREYQCWWDIETLPKLNYERSEALCEAILGIAEKWARPPYAIDGWRLDVAADLGQTRSFNHRFWKRFRQRVKAVNPDILIVAEHYGSPAEWLGGDEWDTVMNYDAFMEPVTYFLTGMEKHSDYRRDDLFQNGPAFFDSMLAAMADLPTPSAQCAMNELSNHDHSRFMTRTNGRPGRLHTAGSAAASEGIRPDVFREAVVIQMTWPGSPTIYYGDEAGVVGWTDPDSRRTYPWDRENRGLIELHRSLATLRARYAVLRRGSVKPLCAGYGLIAYARFDATGWLAVACNNTGRPMSVALPLRDIGVPDGARALNVFSTNRDGFDPSEVFAGSVRDGALNITVAGRGAVVIVPEP